MLNRRPFGELGVDKRKQDGSDKRPVLVSGSAKEHEQQNEDRQIEADEVGIQVLVLLGDDRAGHAAGHRCDDECQDLVPVHAYADRLGSDFVSL